MISPRTRDWLGTRSGRAGAKEIKDNVKHVFDELNGKINHDRLGQYREPLTWPGTLAPIFVGSGEE